MAAAKRCQRRERRLLNDIRHVASGLVHRIRHRLQAARAAAEDQFLPVNHAAAIGDSENDLEMLNAVALPIAMGNASAAVKNLCLRETLTNAQDGVAAAIDRIIAENG